MGREIHPGELKVQAAQAVNLLNTNSEVLLDLIPQIQNFMQEEQLDGTAWSGLKTVLGDYISVIQGTIAAYAMVMVDYQTMVNQIGDEDLVEDELAEQLRVINTAIGINTTCINIYNRMPRQISNIGPIKKAIQRLTSTNTELNRAAGILQSKLEQIDIIEAATNSLFLTAGSYLDAVKEGYQSIHNSWNGSGYQVSGNRDWKQVTEDAWNIYRNQYAQQARDAVLASQNWCVCSKDPVNLSTGNFIYDKTDLQLQGRMSITFTRYYNAMAHAEGSFGNRWSHGFDYRLNIGQRSDGEIILQKGDGSSEVFRPLGKGLYASTYQHTGTLRAMTENLNKEKGDEEKQIAYEYEVFQGYIYGFNAYGHLKQIRDNNANKLTMENDIHGRVVWIEGDGITLQIHYRQGKVDRITDHTGRQVHYSYEDELLHQVQYEDGTVLSYGYDEEGHITEVVNRRGISSVVNEYDREGRTVLQTFPDGSFMSYEYDDKKREVILTERNASRITYIHDEAYRTTDVIYEDGTREHFDYNRRNQKIKSIDRNGNVTKYAYDNRGNLTQYATAGGVKVVCTYNADNKLLVLKENGKERVRNHYDRNGNLTESIGADGNGNKYTYNEHGQPICITNPDGTKLHIIYDAHGNIEKLQNVDGSTTTYQYDACNRVIRTTDGNGNETDYVYDENDHIIETTNPLGNKRSYEYNQNGKITKVVDYDGYSIQASYNELGKISQCIDKEGNVTKLFYDPMWHVNRVIQADGGSIVYQYDGNDRLEQTTLQNGGTIQYHYDGNGNCVEVIQPDGGRINYLYDTSNRMIQEKDETGATTDYTYDMFGNLIEVTDALGNTNQYKYDDNNRCTVKIDALGNSTTYAYDCMGNLTRIQYPDGSMETMRYEAGYRKEYTSRNGGTVSYCYDGNGNCTEIKNAMGEVVQFFYDALNRRIQVINPDGANIRYAYDSVGNITEVTDGRGNTTRYTYTPNGNLKSVMDALGHITNYTYDKMGHLVQVERTGEQQKTIQRTQYEWDISGNVTKVINPLGDMEQFDYDIGNHLIRKTDREGYQTKFTYHADGLLKDILYGDGTSVTYQYNALKQLEEVKDITGTIQIQRDVLGRVKAVTDADGNTTRYEWGSMNERTGLQYPDGSYAGYQYNSQGQLEVLHMEKGDITYTYDTVGRLQEKLFPNGVRTSYRYNPAGQIEAIRHVGENVEENYRYQYDAAGNKTDIWKQRSQMEQGSGHYTYEYDALNQLVGVWKDGQQLRNYTYDSFGNRSQMDNYEQHTNTIYQYNENNQLLISETNGVKQNYHYDKRGNLTTVFQGEEILKQFQFNAANQMISSYESADGKYASYQYNALGKRIGQKVYRMEEPRNLYEDVLPNNPEKDIQYTLDITRPYYDLLGYKDKSNHREQSFYWDANVVSMKEEGEDIYYLQDDLGSPIHLLDAEGRSKATYGYEEFGEIRQFIGDDGFQPFGYTGYQKEEVGGLYYAQARRYDASVGRFVSEDKVKGFAAMPVSLNSYGYCWGNPMVYVDMDGRFPGIQVGLPVTIDRKWGNYIKNNSGEENSEENSNYIGAVYLVNKKGAKGNGHAALLLVKDNQQAEFYSYAGAKGLGAVTTGSEGYLSTAFKDNRMTTVNIEKFIQDKGVHTDSVDNKNREVMEDYTYTDFVYIPITNDEGTAMHNAAMKIRKNPGKYNLWNHNCGQVAQLILEAGEKGFAKTKFDWLNTRPNTVYNNIIKEIDDGKRKGWKYGAIEDLSLEEVCEDE